MVTNRKTLDKKQTFQVSEFAQTLLIPCRQKLNILIGKIVRNRDSIDLFQLSLRGLSLQAANSENVLGRLPIQFDCILSEVRSLFHASMQRWC